MVMRAKNTALILIGYQNDYFAEDGILRGVVDESSRVTGVFEQVFYCDEVFPLYATVTDSKSVVRELTMEAEAI